MGGKTVNVSRSVFPVLIVSAVVFIMALASIPAGAVTNATPQTAINSTKMTGQEPTQLPQGVSQKW